MSIKLKFKLLPAIAISLAAILALGLLFYGAEKQNWQRIRSSLAFKVDRMKIENKALKSEIAALERQNVRLEKYVSPFGKNFKALDDAACICPQIETDLAADLPVSLAAESHTHRQMYLKMTAEKKRWDRFHQAQYKSIMESTVEPRIFEVQNLVFINEESREHFLELEVALKWHRRLIRDVRLFHDEIQYQKKQRLAQQPYELYELKFGLAPFARESALADALQQAMSALSIGIYEYEAQDVLDRIGQELTRPIRQLYDDYHDVTNLNTPVKYPYNLYTVFGPKLMDYSEALARQSSITLGPSAYGELDYFNRRLYDSLYDLYEIGQEEVIDRSHLDIHELEKLLYSRN